MHRIHRLNKIWAILVVRLCISLLCLCSFAQAQVDTVSNYTNLIVYSNSADSVYVDHPRYYGLFVKGSCTSSDWGTKILSTSDCWERVHSNFLPRFWDLSGQTPSNIVRPVRLEVDAVNAAAYAAWSAGGDTIEIDSMIPIDRPVLAMSQNIYFGTTDSAGFRRVTPPKTILTDTAHVGDGLLHVQDNTGFLTFQKINISHGQGYDSIAGFTSYTASVSTVFGGDSIIFLSGLSVQKMMVPGDTVSLFFPMVQNIGLGTDSLHFVNLVFDGNRSHYNLNYDWRTNPTMTLSTSLGSSIEHCRFYGIPNENMIVCGADVIDCSGIGFNGSAVHFSCNNNGTPTDILYNQFTALNAIGDAVMEHSEAGFTFSAKVRNFRISYNTLNYLNEDGIGKFSNDDSSNVITDNLLETNAQNVSFLPFYQYGSTNTIYNNKNPNNADLSTDSCVILQPQLTSVLPCLGGSSISQPLQLGDTITLTLDSLFVRNSNENYVKQIVPIFSDSLFGLADATVNTSLLSPFHHWAFKDSAGFAGLEFDNGHREGVLAPGNWGYEPCGIPGGCTHVSFSFVLQNLPTYTSAVSCPLRGVQVVYDGESGTWESGIVCNNEPALLDSTLLGKPFIQGTDTCHTPTGLNSVHLTNSVVQLKWDTIPGATAYRVWYKPIGANSWTKVVKGGNQGRRVLMDLDENTQYRWMIQVRCGSSWGLLSSRKWFSTDVLICDEVLTSSLLASPVLLHQARFNWTAQPGAFKYEIRWRPIGGSNWTSVEKHANKEKHLVSGLTTGTNYEWQLRTICKDGNTLFHTNWSAPQPFTTLTSREGVFTTDLPSSPNWEIYPNPASSTLTFASNTTLISQLQILDVFGHVVVQQQLSQEETEQLLVLDISRLAPGVYYVVVQTKIGQQQKMLIVQ